MGEDQIVGLRDEVEVIVLVDQVLGRVALRLEVARGPVAVDQLPAAVHVDGVPRVVDGA